MKIKLDNKGKHVSHNLQSTVSRCSCISEAVEMLLFKGDLEFTELCFVNVTTAFLFVSVQNI